MILSTKQPSDPPAERSKHRAPWPRGQTSVSLGERLRSASAAGIAILLCGIGSSYFTEGAGLRTLVASMGASAVILFAVPNSPMAKPWPLAGGHLISGLIGVLCYRWIPEPWPAAAVAVGLSIFAMHTARCLHPPGGASALIPVLGGTGIRDLGFQFLLTPLALNVAILWLASEAFNRLRRHPNAPEGPKPRIDPRPLQRLGIRTEDLQTAIREMNAFVDVSEDDLNAIYKRAAKHAYHREFGTITCGHIMSRNLVTVEFGEALEDTWRLMQQEGVKTIPVIDRGRHVLGIITLTDFFRHARARQFRGLADHLRRWVRRTPEVTSTKPEVAGQIMTTPAITARKDTPLAELAEILTERGIHQLSILDADNKLAGLVTQSDLIAGIYRLLLPAAQGSSPFGEGARADSPQPRRAP